MRVTSQTYSNLIISSSQSAQQQLAQLQQEISTGDSVQVASDNPLSYQLASQDQSMISQLNAYSSAASVATTATAQNNQAMTNIHQLLAQAGEYATTVSSDTSSTDMGTIATEMSDLLDQLTSVVNQKDSNGNYLFGGTANQPPLTSSGTYNSATNGATQTIEVQQGNAVQTGIVAGRSGSPPVDGFLYDSSTGVDVVGALNQTITDLKSGNATSVMNTDLPALNNALNLVSQYVGSTTASMSAVSAATTSLTQQLDSQNAQVNNLTQTNLPNITVQLQQIQNQYQASLEAGSRILSLSMLNYMGSVPTS